MSKHSVDLAQLEKSLWDAADELRANSGLKASEYGGPVLGLIFLRFADAKFQAAQAEIEAKASARRRIGPSDYHAAGVIYLTEAARFGYLLDLPEGSDELSIYGQEKTRETVRLAQMNMAVHGLTADIREANSYYEDPHDSTGRFDFVMANPPFNVDRVDKTKLEGDARFPALPRADNANYLWIQLFATSLNETGRAGFVMANSSSDARHSEGDIRRRLIEERMVDVMVAVGTNFFYTVTLPVTLWFLDRGKRATDRADRVLFVDAPKVFRRIDRAHRDFTDAQLELLANIVRLYRGEEPEFEQGSGELFDERFPLGEYVDVAGLCKIATIAEIEAQGWSLNPGRYVGTELDELDDVVFEEKLAAAQAELRELGARAAKLEAGVDRVLSQLLDR